MAGYTYEELKQAVQDYTDNNEAVFVNNIDNFIKSAEDRILNEAQLEVFHKNAYSKVAAGNKYMRKPADWLFTYSCAIREEGETDDYVFLLNKEPNFIHEFWPNPTVNGKPRYYADFDVENFLIAPTPDSDYYIELHYFYRPVSLVDTVASKTWLSENAAPALLYGTLVEAYTFMKGEPDMIQQYEQTFQRSMGRLSAFAAGAEGLDFYKRPVT